MLTLALATVAVLVILYVVPLVIYGTASAFGGMELPTEASPRQFLLGVLVTKLGTAIAFVWLFELTAAAWDGRWLLYGLIWFLMFAASEIGEAISARSTWRDAVLGIASEAIYAPASAFAVYRILGAA